MTDEEFYDAEIAPKLLELRNLCAGRNMPFVACVEYEHGSIGRTEFFTKDAGIGQKMATWAARANGNVDSLMIAIQRHAEQHGHNSAILAILESRR